MDSPLIQLPQSDGDNGELYLIGFRVDPAAEGPQFFTLIGSRQQIDRPITREARVLLFHQPAQAARALELSDNGLAGFGPVPTELELLCDVGEALHVANQKDADDDGFLFEMIAVFDDLLREVKLAPPADFAAALARLAARLGQGSDFSSLLNSGELNRALVEDALLWCLGALISKSSWIG